MFTDQRENQSNTPGVGERRLLYQKEMDRHAREFDAVIDLAIQRIRDESDRFTSPLEPFDPIGGGIKERQVQCRAITGKRLNEAEVFITEEADNGTEKLLHFIYLKRKISWKKIFRGNIERVLVFRTIEIDRSKLDSLADLSFFDAEGVSEPWYKETIWNFPDRRVNPKQVLADLEGHIKNWKPTGESKGVSQWIY